MSEENIPMEETQELSPEEQQLMQEQYIKQMQELYKFRHTPWVKVSDIGRNDPCPCGSGKKYKNCCLRKDEKQFNYSVDYVENRKS